MYFDYSNTRFFEFLDFSNYFLAPLDMKLSQITLDFPNPRFFELFCHTLESSKDRSNNSKFDFFVKNNNTTKIHHVMWRVLNFKEFSKCNKYDFDQKMISLAKNDFTRKEWFHSQIKFTCQIYKFQSQRTNKFLGMKEFRIIGSLLYAHEYKIYIYLFFLSLPCTFRRWRGISTTRNLFHDIIFVYFQFLINTQFKLRK